MVKLALLFGFVGLTVAAPLADPQQIDFNAIVAAVSLPSPTLASAPIIITIQTAAIGSLAAAPDELNVLPTYSAFVKRSALPSGCSDRAPQPSGAGPVPSPDTASAFLAYAYFSSVAVSAPVPSGYIKAFTNLHAENQAYGYLGYSVLNSYDTQACAAQCDNIHNCQSINILFERDPIVDPDIGCENPPSTSVIKCVFWGSPVTSQNALNHGQWRNQFQVVVSGSNGYVSQKYPTIGNYTGPTILNSAVINAPLDCNGENTYMGYKSWNDGKAFDPARCAATCTAQSEYNLAHPPAHNVTPMLCKFFDTYLLLKNGFIEAQVCAMYTETWNATYATNTGYTSGKDVYTIASSVTYSNTKDHGYCVKRH